MFGMYAFFRTVKKKVFQSLVPESLYHNMIVTYMVTVVNKEKNPGEAFEQKDIVVTFSTRQVSLRTTLCKNEQLIIKSAKPARLTCGGLTRNPQLLAEFGR